jgi:hypothetical protein
MHSTSKELFDMMNWRLRAGSQDHKMKLSLKQRVENEWGMGN